MRPISIRSISSGSWNRLYGARGMRQYQCVIPWGEERIALPALLGEITRAGAASFLAVLKTFGDKPSPGLLSFPRPGTTLALDFPNRGEATLALMSRLDAIVREAKGALYPAKDGRMPAEMFRRSFPQWESVARLKDPAMNSDFWQESVTMSAAPKRIAILGAASAIAEAAARLWAAQGARFVLVGRNGDRLQAIAADLRARGAASVEPVVADCASVDAVATLDCIAESLGGLDVVLLAYGALGEQSELERDPRAAAELLRTNFVSAAGWCLAAANRFERQRSGALIVIGSVAGDRGRRSNYRIWCLKGGARSARTGPRTPTFELRRAGGPDQTRLRRYADDSGRRPQRPALGAAGGGGANDRVLR